MIESVVVSHQGNVRECNEDSVLESSNLGLWLVADGVGGNGGGDVASQLAVQTVEREMRQGKRLLEAIEIADRKICESASTNPDLQNMATTLVACHIEDNHYAISWVGDSRAYFFDSGGELSLLSLDHNYANHSEALAAPEYSHKADGEHELTQALGELSLSRLPKIVGDLHHGEMILLCSDGLSGVLSHENVAEVLNSKPSLGEASQALIDDVLEAGAPDNVSLALIRYSEEDEALKASDFNYRSAFDTSRYSDKSKSRPVFLLLVLISILVILTVF
jgi:protein phosphatase